MSALVSIIIPCFNSESTIRRAIESCLSQTHLQIEVIVVDDASIDNSRKIVRQICEREDRVKFFDLPKNMGVSYARNFGLRVASGDFISTLDSDDFYEVQKIEYELKALMSGEFVAAFSGVKKIDLAGTHIENKSFPRVIFRKDIIYRRWVPRDFLIKRELLIAHSLMFDENISIFEDWDWKLRLASHGPMINSGVTGTHYVQHEEGLSSISGIKIIFGLMNVFLRNCTRSEYLGFAAVLYNSIFRR